MKVLLSIFLMPLSNVVICNAQNWSPRNPVREFINYRIPGTCWTRYDRLGPFIVCNPNGFAQMPPFMYVCIRVHEYGHIDLNHRMRFGPSLWEQQQAEAEADWYSGNQLSRSDPDLFQAIVAYLENVVGPNGGDNTHGSGWQRAQFMKRGAESPEARTLHSSRSRRVPQPGNANGRGNSSKPKVTKTDALAIKSPMSEMPPRDLRTVIDPAKGNQWAKLTGPAISGLPPGESCLRPPRGAIARNVPK